MSISSAPQDYSITSIDSSDIITIDLSSMNTASASTITVTGGGYTVGNISVGPITIDDLSGYRNEWTIHEEFVNCFPDWERVQNMCKEYPGLKIAFEKFVTTYKLVKDDYDTPEDQRLKP